MGNGLTSTEEVIAVPPYFTHSSESGCDLVSEDFLVHEMNLVTTDLMFSEVFSNII